MATPARGGKLNEYGFAHTYHILEEVRQRLKVRGDTLLDSDGVKLHAEQKAVAEEDQDAANAIKEIHHRRSEQIA